jgi:predicted metal-dependent peptidase
MLEHPFIGSLVMHLPLRAASPQWCETVATDARALYFNAEFIDTLDLAQTQFVLAHEAMHCALGHFARRSHRTVRRWHVACDHAVNLLLVDEGLTPPPGALLDPAYRGLCAEEIYPLIPQDTAERTLDADVDGAAGSARFAAAGASGVSAPDAQGSAISGTEPGESWDDARNEGRTDGAVASVPPALPASQVDALAQAWQSRMVAAAQQARRAGRLAPMWMRLVDELIQPELPWRMLLARYMMTAARDDYSYHRPSRREGDALLPRAASGEVDVCVAIDTSGSIAAAELAEFVAEVDALKAQVRARVTLLACDERLDERSPWRFSAWEPVLLPEGLHGGGGTSFVPVFEWIAHERYRPDLLVYFTDAEGDFPEDAPDYPVVWLVKGRATVPWGERVQLN